MKNYVIDSSVFLYAPYALRVFEKNDVHIPMLVIRELAHIAKNGGEHHREAIAFGRMMDGLLDAPGRTAELEGGGRLFICGLNDEDIFTTTQAIPGAILVSRDPMVRVMARSRNIPAEPFRYEQSELSDKPYTGRCVLYVSHDEMCKFADTGKLALDPKKQLGDKYTAVDADGEDLGEGYSLTVNEYVVLTDMDDPQRTMLGRFNGHEIVKLSHYALGNGQVFGITPRNVGQRFALDALMNPDIPLVILRGPAGTAKSFLSMAAGLQQAYEPATRIYKKILLTRPNTKMDNDIGYLKGDEKDKTMPILRGLLDNIGNLMMESADDPVAYLLEHGVLEMQSMAYMRGRSITDQFIVVDEMQNSTPNQALSIITRVGEGTKIVVGGDVEQIDSAFLDVASNGLTFAAERMKGSPLCAQITFSKHESTRSPLAQEAIRRMGSTIEG